MRKFVQFVSKFPFAGKAAIRPAFREFISSKARERHKAIAWLSTLLSALILGHGYQARMGFSAIGRLMQAPMRFKAFWHAVFISYTAVNIAVTVAQVYLLMYALYIYVSARRTALIGPRDDFTNREVLAMLLVTLGGQFLFLYGHLHVQ